MAYVPVLGSSEIRFLARLSAKQRQRVLAALDQLHGASDKEADSAGADASGRRLWAVVIDRVEIVFWIDHAVCQIMVISLSLFRR